MGHKLLWDGNGTDKYVPMDNPGNQNIW